jgi:FMN phosphatase YigB (HAD superfamily)
LWVFILPLILSIRKVACFFRWLGEKNGSGYGRLGGMEMADIEWLFLDLGGVLYRLDYEGVLRGFCKRCGKSPGEINDILRATDLFHLYESGALSTFDFYRVVTERLDCSMKLEEFSGLWNSLLIKRDDMFRIVNSLKTRVSLLFLSNTNELNARVIDSDLERITDKIIYSYRIGFLKPDPRIYRIALKTAGSEPGKHQFKDAEDLIELLHAHNI